MASIPRLICCLIGSIHLTTPFFNGNLCYVKLCYRQLNDVELFCSAKVYLYTE